MLQKCTMCGALFTIRVEDLRQLEQLSPVIGGKTFSLPPPSLCPNCRHRRRIAARNERRLFRQTCALSGKPIVAAIPPSVPVKVCERALWLEIDNTEFGRPIDFTRPFFPQFFELYQDTYKANVIQGGEMVNSEFTHFTGWLRNCYLLFDSGKSEDCMYGALVGQSKNCLDGHSVLRSELCYEGFRLENCYAVADAAFCKGCSNSEFLFDCIGCSDCLGCVNLRNKQYYVLNEPVGRERYLEARAQHFGGSYLRRQAFRKRFEVLLSDSPRRASYMVNNANSTGENLSSCEGAHQCYDAAECKDCSYCYDFYFSNRDCVDISAFGQSMEQCYELSGCGGYLTQTGMSHCYFSQYIFYGGHQVLYSMNCHEHCRDLFGCADLRRKESCILNLQYTPSEYQSLAKRLVEHMEETGEWGEFFPMSASLFGYNESLASEDFPATQAECLAFGARWSDYVPPGPGGTGQLAASSLPDSIHETDDDICATAVICEVSGRPYRVLPAELHYYRTCNLPLPRLHPEERQRRRSLYKRRGQISARPCAACGEGVSTSYRPQDAVKVYCERCFDNLVY